MVTGRISLRSPEYSPISSSVSEVRDQLPLPLPARDGVGDQDERRGTGFGHRSGTDHRLTRAAERYDDTRAARPERLGCELLVVAQLPVGLVELDRVCLTVDVARGSSAGQPT